LLQVLMQAPNVLILDEPTNDLDVQTLAVLEEYLEEFNGCVIVVSHDRYFLDRTVDTVFAFEDNGNIRQYPGNYSIYLDYKQRQEAAAKAVEQEQQAAQIQPLHLSLNKTGPPRQPPSRRSSLTKKSGNMSSSKPKSRN
jgi:ATP-binding cassette subfamily F protein uup